MSKIGAKEAALAALRARGARSKPVAKAKVRKPAKARPGSTVEVRPRKPGVAFRPPITTPVVKPKIGRPSTGFDRVAYQRVYTRLRRLYGPKPSWPPAALAQLRLASTPT